MSKLRHWWIQKPRAHNCPLEKNGVVFCEFQPTISMSNCEWIKVYSAEDIEEEIFRLRRQLSFVKSCANSGEAVTDEEIEAIE